LTTALAPSTRIKVPKELAEAASLPEMAQSARLLGELDTPQAIPCLGELYGRAPGRLRLLLDLAWATVLSAIALVLLWILILVAAALLVYRTPGLASLSGFLGLTLWGAVGLLWMATILLMARPVRQALSFQSLKSPEDLPGWLGIVLWPGRLITWLTGFAVVIVSVAGLVLTALYGLAWLVTWLETLGAERELAAFALLGVAMLVTLLITFRKTAFFLGIFWLPGVLGLYQSDPSLWHFGIALGLGLLYPLRLAFAGARGAARPFLNWQKKLLRLVQGWRLQASLSEAFALQCLRNQNKIANRGDQAVCQAHLIYFVKQSAGPMSFWWCPVCHDDMPLFTGVKTICGVLDQNQPVQPIQHGNELCVNLRAWLESSALIPPVLQEVYIDQLHDEHDVEWFIVQYNSQQSQQGWPPLRQMHVRIAANAKLSEHVLRQIQQNFGKVLRTE